MAGAELFQGLGGLLGGLVGFADAGGDGLVELVREDEVATAALEGVAALGGAVGVDGGGGLDGALPTAVHVEDDVEAAFVGVGGDVDAGAEEDDVGAVILGLPTRVWGAGALGF